MKRIHLHTNNYPDDKLWQDSTNLVKSLGVRKKLVAKEKVIFVILHLSVCVLA